MKLSRTAALAAVVSAMTMTACAARTIQPVSDPARWEGDPRLYAFLNVYPLESEQRDSLAAYAADHVTYTDALLAQAAEDRNAPAEVRINALLMLSERAATMQLSAFSAALDDPDARIRAMAVSSMRRFMEIRPIDAMQLARRGLQDASPEVQAQALHVIAERDPDVLRSYERNAATSELRTIARDLVRVAEERGAPLAGDTATGTLQRDTPHGFTITFTPRAHWPQWQAAVGDVTIQRPGAPAVTLTGIEAVAGVVPVFLSPDGEYVVYERERRIVVRALGSGEERVEGPGNAPRTLPFTDRFIYLREQTGARSEVRQVTRLRYDVVMSSFATPAGAEPNVIGDLTGIATYEQHGAYSAVRWMRVEDRGGAFFLHGDGIDTFALPDPFATLP